MKVVFWAPDINHHHAETWVAFQSLAEEPIRIVTWSLLDQSRKKQGWTPQKYEELNAEILTRDSWWSQGTNLINSNLDAIHVFVGFWTIRAFFPLFLYALRRGVKTAVLNEPYSTSCIGYFQEEPFILSWIKVKARPFLYRFTAFLIRVLSNKKSPCILSLSLIAKKQFIHAGFNPQSIFPYGYFVSRNPVTTFSIKHEGSDIRVVFVGSLIKTKGLDIAVQAIEALSNEGARISLDVYGPGDPDLFIPHSSKNIHYRGIIPLGQAQQVISKYDLLILPSRHDGWGLVVNEALLQGVPVIVSDRVGAKCLIEASDSGLIFKSEDVNDLIEKLKLLINDEHKIKSLRLNTLNVALKIIPGVAAEYLLTVFNYYFYNKGNRPSAIWCE